MSAARLPYYQQDHPTDQQRRGGRGQRGYPERHASGSHRRDRSRSVERRRYSRSRSHSRSRSRSAERTGQRRRRDERNDERRQQQPTRYHRERDSRERSRDRDRDRDRERDRDYSRRSGHYCRSDSPASGSGVGVGVGGSLSSSSSSSQRRHRQSSGDPNGAHPNSHNEAQPANSRSHAMSAVGAYYNLDTEEPFDKERIHREMEEKLREALAREGKVYPPRKPEPPSHPVFANDGSFMELFKKMQSEKRQQLQLQLQVGQDYQLESSVLASGSTELQPPIEAHPGIPCLPAIAVGAVSSATAPYIAAAAAGKSAPPPPMVGRRRGGKVLKTGMVAKLKTQNEQEVDPKDFWSLYLAEVNKYKSNACDTDNGKRPLVK
ncbi:zinc finger CCCH domain-containing protein 13 [Drosophila madeirensis]|uniref:Zinc finger CCCH domain-containing protein 13 n=1 Tax=Drosophila madeirensis TaxID=30013 RepID=A0AAU9FXG1_DROMD